MRVCLCVNTGVQHVHREPGNSRFDRRFGRHADEHGLHLHRRLDVRPRSVSAVDRCRLHGQHGVHTEPVHTQPGPLLVGHQPAQVPAQTHHQPSPRHDLAGMKILILFDSWKCFGFLQFFGGYDRLTPSKYMDAVLKTGKDFTVRRLFKTHFYQNRNYSSLLLYVLFYGLF